MENILSQFLKYERLHAIVPFGNGHINHTFRVEVLVNGALEKYVLQKINHHVFQNPEAVMENIGLVAKHLSSKDYPLKILRPRPALSGRMFHFDEAGEYWRLFPFFENTFAPEKVENEEDAFEAAKAFGQFAKALDDMEAHQLKVTIPCFHDGLSRMQSFKQVLADAPEGKLKKAKEEVDEILQSESLFQKIADLETPLRVIHHDTKINNLLFDLESKKPIVVIDLDTVMPGTILSDFGDLVRTSACPAEEDESDLSKVIFRNEIYRAISEGFLSELDSFLTKAEKENLHLAGPWLTLMQAVRFLTDYLAGDVYYSTKYPEHNLVRTRCQLRLFQEMKRNIGLEL